MNQVKVSSKEWKAGRWECSEGITFFHRLWLLSSITAILFTTVIGLYGSISRKRVIHHFQRFFFQRLSCNAAHRRPQHHFGSKKSNREWCKSYSTSLKNPIASSELWRWARKEAIDNSWICQNFLLLKMASLVYYSDWRNNHVHLGAVQGSPPAQPLGAAEFSQHPVARAGWS